ncbi:MAG: GTPase HflX [Gammaproteobacteria bacterium]|nr:GTPase HflX [Gammaproteobacteria bacterium]MCK5092412.1 GTPase HflX [Gammaproteobacteria bacterium]
MFDRPRSGERAILVHLNLQSEGQYLRKSRHYLQHQHSQQQPQRQEGEDLQEFQELALSAGAQIVEVVQGTRNAPDSRYFIGSGKVEEISQLIEQHKAELVLFNHSLSPSQERNLEGALKCRVLDRTGLILDIFAQRARSFEGKLQVELAQLNHLSTRLVRGWTHLERQKGGIGLRGPGETQLETDRRLLGNRIKQLKRRLVKVRKQRDMGSRARRRADVPTVSLVGYTNAGKSTLFNCLTSADVYVADQLFATLDPTLRRLTLPSLPGESVVLADTVGFIRHLPHDLVEAFRSTLEETSQANLLLHVIDSSDEEHNAYIEQVNDVLAQIGADTVPQIQVYNKIDLSGAEPRIDRNSEGEIWRIWLSANTGEGLDLLRQALEEHLLHDVVLGQVTLPADQGRVRALLYEQGAVSEEEHLQNGDYLLNLKISRNNLEQIQKREGITLEFLSEQEELLARHA